MTIFKIDAGDLVKGGAMREIDVEVSKLLVECNKALEAFTKEVARLSGLGRPLKGAIGRLLKEVDGKLKDKKLDGAQIEQLEDIRKEVEKLQRQMDRAGVT